MAEYGGVGLSGLSAEDISSFNDKIASTEQAAAETAAYNNYQEKQFVSKAQEKARRIQQTKERKQRELVGPDPIDYGTDSIITRKAKELLNKGLPHDYQIPVEMNGKQYTTHNKDFNNDDLSNIWAETEDNPYGDSVLYYMRKEDGYNDDGSVKWLYKPGIAKFGAYNRYKNQLADEGWQLLGEKRTNNAAQIEARIQGNQTFLQQRTFDHGRSTTDPYAVGPDQAFNSFGAGKSELYNTDILGLGNQTDQQITQNRIRGLENEAAYRMLEAQDPDGKLGNLVDALQSRTVSTVAGVLDAGHDFLSDNENNELNKWKDTAYTDKLFGYNSRVSASGLDKAAYDMKNGNYFSMIGNMFSVAPELIAESTPEMVALSNIYGMGSILAMRSNDVMDEIKKNNGGKALTSGEKAQAISAGTLMTMLDKFGLNEMTSKTAFGKRMVKKIFDSSTEQASKHVAHKIGEKVVQLSVAGEMEAGTEMLQEIVQAYGEKYGTDKADELWNQEMKDSIIKAGLGGFSAGTTIRAGFDTAQGVTDMNKNAGSDIPEHIQAANSMVDLNQKAQNGEKIEITDQDIQSFNKNLQNMKDTFANAKDPEAQKEAATAWMMFVDNRLARDAFGLTEEQHTAELELARKTIQEAGIELPTIDGQDKPIEVTPEEAPAFSTADEYLNEDTEKPKKKKKKKEKPVDTTTSTETFRVDGVNLDIEATLVKENKNKARYEYVHPQTGKKSAIVVNKTTGEIETLYNEDAGTSIDGKKTTTSMKAHKITMGKKNTNTSSDENIDSSSTPGPLKAGVESSGLVLETIKSEPKVSQFKEVMKNVVGKFIKKEASNRKQLNRKSEGLVDDSIVVDSFLHGASDSKINNSPKLFKKQTDTQSKQTREEKAKLVEAIQNIVKSGKISSSEKVNMKFREMFKANEGGALRLAVLALNEVTENMKSIVDRANNENLDVETFYASRQDIAKEIARKFVASYMVQFVKVDGQSDLAIDTEYINIGNVALDMLESMGYIQYMPEGEGLLDVGVQDVWTDNNKKADRGETEKVNGKNVPYLTGSDVITFKQDDAIKVRGHKDNVRSNSLMSKYSEMLSPILQALNPGNERIPDHAPSLEDVEARDHTMSKNRNETIIKMASQPVYIKPDIIELLKEIALGTKNITLADYMNKNEWVKIMFGIEQKDSIPTEYLSDSGKNKSRMANAEAVIDAIKQYMEAEAAGEQMNMAELYFTYFSAVNMRIHADEIAFNFQSDNFFARHILSPVETEYVTETKEEVESLVLAVAEELSTPSETISPEEVMFYQEPSKDAQETILDGLNALLQTGAIEDTKYYYNKVLMEHPRTKALMESGKSINSIIKVLQAVQAIRDGVAEADGDWTKAKIRSNYAVEFDGNTSGLMNKLLNMLGGENHDAILKMLRHLSIADKDGRVGDGYLLLAEEVKSLLDKRISEADKKWAGPIETQNIQELKDIVAFIQDIDANMRETSKSPMMTNIYGQLKESMGGLLGSKIVSKSLKKDMDSAKKIIRMLNGQDKAPKEFTYKDKMELSKKVGEIIGDVFDSALTILNKPLNEDSNAMYEAYDSMHKASRDIDQKLVMRSPFDIVYQRIFGRNDNSAFTNKYAFSIEKKKIVAMGEAIIDRGSVIPTQEEFLSNQNSQKVMPLHAIDSAILLLAYEKTMRAMGLDFDGSMSVHDAVYSTPKFMNTYREMYNEAALEVAEHYDLIDETVFQIDELLKEMTKRNLKNAVYQDLLKHRAELTKNQDARKRLKKETLAQLKADGISVFGTHSQSMPEPGKTPDPRPEKTKKTAETKSVEPVAEVKADQPASIKNSEQIKLGFSVGDRLDIMWSSLESSPISGTEVTSVKKIDDTHYEIEARNTDQKKKSYSDAKDGHTTNSSFGNLYKMNLSIDKNGFWEMTSINERILTEPNSVYNSGQNKIKTKKVNINHLVKSLLSGKKISADLSLKILNQLKDEISPEGQKHIDSIIGFIEGKGKVVKGKNFEYIPEKDTIVVPDGTYNNVKDTEGVIRYIAHEIEHKATAQYLFNESKKDKPSKEYKYIRRFLDRLKKADLSSIMYEEKNAFGQNTYDRVQYIIDPDKSEYEQMAEFVAIYRTNEAFRDVIKNNLSTSTGAVNVLLKSIRSLVNAGMKALTKFKAKDFSMETLNNVMNNIVILGEDARMNQEGKDATPLGAMTIKSEIDQALNYKPYKGQTPLYFMPFESKIVGFNAWAHEGMKRGINAAILTISENEMIQKWHKKQMSIEEGFYYKTASFIKRRFEPGAFLARLATYMELNEEFDYKDIRQWHTAMNKAKQARNHVDTDLLIRAKREFDRTTKEYSAEEKRMIESIFNSSLVHELRNTNGSNSIIDQILESENPVSTIDQFIEEITKQLTSGDLAIKDQSIVDYTPGKLAEDIANYYRTGKLGDLVRGTNEMNDAKVMSRLGGQKLSAFKTLIALNQLKMGGNEEISVLKKFKNDSSKSESGNSYNEFMMVSASNHYLSYMADKDAEGHNQNKFDNVTGAHIMFDESYEFLAVDSEQFKNLEQEEDNEWIVLQQPDKQLKKIGVVARVRTDFGKQPGVVAGTNLNSDGVSILSKDAERMDASESNIMRVGSRGNYQYKVILTNEMISKLKVTENPASVMYRSYGHNTEISEGKSTLNHILKNEVREVKTKEDADSLEAALKKGGRVGHMFLNLDLESIDMRDYPMIRKTYSQRKDTTNVLGFNNRVNMVHKNMEDTMVGYTRDAVTNRKNPKLRKAESILRNAVTMFAGHVVMANPAKITFDALSNLSILMANNVPFLSMRKYGSEAMKYGVEITELRNKYIEEQMFLFSMTPGSEEYKDQKKIVDNAYDQVQNHPFSAALNNGMIQSLSTSMMMKDKESMSDLQKRANYIFEMIGDIPGARKAIFGFAKFGSKYGLGIEDVLSYAAKRSKDGSTLEKELKYMAQKFDRIKKEEDIAAYLSEIVATPGQSEIIRVGGVAVLGVDLASKWILYKHTVDTFKEDPRFKNMTEQQRQELAIQTAVNSFINYMDNLPKEIDMMKELGIWMFPHFLLRVQKVIWGLFYNRLFGSGLATATAAISGTFGPAIYGSAVPAKMPSHYDPLNPDTFFPTQIVNIPFV